MSTGFEAIGCFKSQNGEDRNGGIEGGSTIYYAYDESIPFTVVSEEIKKNVRLDVTLHLK